MAEPISEALIARKQEFIDILERQTGEIYSRAKSYVLSVADTSPLSRRIAENYISANQRNWLKKMEDKIAELAEISFLSEETSLEEALMSADGYLNATIGGFAQNKLGIAPDVLKVAFGAIFGVGM